MYETSSMIEIGSMALIHPVHGWQSKPPKEDHLSITAKRLFPNGVCSMEVPLYK